MNDERGAVIIERVYDADLAPAATAADDHQLATADFPRITATRIAGYTFNFRDRAPVPGRVLLIPFNPAELHDLII